VKTYRVSLRDLGNREGDQSGIRDSNCHIQVTIVGAGWGILFASKKSREFTLVEY
jgi:hypothetical protein